MSVHPLVIEEIVRRGLLEDLGHGQDLTSNLTISADKKASAYLVARQSGILSGVAAVAAAFRITDPDIALTLHGRDGENLEAGANVMTIEGSARSILTAERTALNLVSHLSGIATRTKQYVDAVSGTGVGILCSRKTLPGLRALQKQAVRDGGGINHRFGLDDAVLIKDNHIALAGGVDAALRAAKAGASHMVKIEIEVDTLEQLEEVLAFDADVILLDNMPPEMLRQAVKMVKGRALTEASGGITLQTVRAVAETGVDFISVGALTHSVTALDFGLDIS